MFSLATAAMLAAPRLCTPMMPMFSFSLGERLCAIACRPATQKPAPANAELLRNSRRFQYRAISASLSMNGKELPAHHQDQASLRDGLRQASTQLVARYGEANVAPIRPPAASIPRG